MDKIFLSDGTELVPLELEEKEKLESEIKVILDKYNATYLPVISEEKSITRVSQVAKLFLMKIKKVDEKETDTTEEVAKEETK